MLWERLKPSCDARCHILVTNAVAASSGGSRSSGRRGSVQRANQWGGMLRERLKPPCNTGCHIKFFNAVTTVCGRGSYAAWSGTDFNSFKVTVTGVGGYCGHFKG